MRISTNFIFENSRRIMQQSISNLLKVQEVMASQRKINRLSDDPVGAGKILNTDAMISQTNEFLRNLGTAQTLSQLYDSSMESAVGVLSRVKELLLAEANSATSTPQTREAARIEIVSLASQMVSIGNLQYGDRFLYAGYLDDTAPFLDLTVAVAPAGGGIVTRSEVSDPALVTGDVYQIVFTAPGVFDVVNVTQAYTVLSAQPYTSGGIIQFDGITISISDDPGPPPGPTTGDAFNVTTTPAGQYVGDQGVIKLEVEQDVFRQVNFTGDRVFNGVGLPPGSVDIFALFERANVALRANDQIEINQLLADFDQATDQMVTQQSLAGSRQNLFSTTTDRLLDVNMQLKMLVSELRDVDVTEAVTELQKQENAYQAVLHAISAVIQPTLLDFLR